ncbi:MAG: hypothetical protein SGPRY_011452 [Prymnesium sp.]
MVTHAKSWQNDREETLRLRYLANPRSPTIYQCDDKCAGSYWQQLPVPMSGREVKANAKIQYHLYTQANRPPRERELKPHKVRLIRRTNGGSDNVATTTHFFHWLLVCSRRCSGFASIKAGHSHTEICDRLFSITKAIFESGSRTRVASVEDFPQLIKRIREELQNEIESLIFDYDFANLDFKRWMTDQKLVGDHYKTHVPVHL